MGAGGRTGPVGRSRGAAERSENCAASDGGHTRHGTNGDASGETDIDAKRVVDERQAFANCFGGVIVMSDMIAVAENIALCERDLK